MAIWCLRELVVQILRVYIRHDFSKGEKSSNTSLRFFMWTSEVNMYVTESIQLSVTNVCRFGNHLVVDCGNIASRTSMVTTSARYLVV